MAACVLCSGLFVSFSAFSQNSIGSPETVFFSQLEDVPLMPGLTELADQTVFFDKPEGRIIESVALMGDASRRDVEVYYGGILAQFGWGRIDDTRFFREKEYLELSFENRDGDDVVKIMVRPSL